MAVAIGNFKKVLGYKNEEVIHRFVEDFAYSLPDARAIFTETKKWLWLCAEQSKQGAGTQPLLLFDEAEPIDLMWHTFLLFTKDYRDFCTKYLGVFIDHVPQSRAAKRRFQASLKKDAKKARQKRMVLMRGTYEFIYDRLGAETLEFWCENLPKANA